MNQTPVFRKPAVAPGITLGDIYYILFRHKWRILICSTIGFLAAGALYKFNPPPFISEAKLFVRYVATESKAPTPNGGDSIKTPDQRGETIMDSEEEILTSLDLAKQVASTIGPEKILAKVGGGNDLNRAAQQIHNGLVVEVPPRSTVMRIAFHHPDLEIVQPVLKEVIASYLKMHLAIHHAGGLVNDILIQETDTLRTRLAQTEEDLRKAKNKAGLISLEDTKNGLTGEMAHLQAEIFNAQAELAERSSVFEQLTHKSAPTAAAPTEQQAKPPASKVAEYRNAVNKLDGLHRREQELLAQFTEENSRVMNIRAQLAEAEATVKKLEEEFPALALSNFAPSSSGSNGNQQDSINLVTESARLNALQAKIKTLNAQMDLIRAQAQNVDQVEGAITELRRQKELLEANYRYYSASIEQSRINEALSTGKVSNISPIQNPSPPAVDAKKTFKVVAGVAIGGIALGLAWSFLIELYLDRSIRRPIDVERLLGVPLFLSIPILGKKGKLRQLKSATKEPLELQSGNDNGALVTTANAAGQKDAESTRTENSLILHSFHETLRDRLISYFESVNLTHKPKLVAVTGLGRGSGVTTTAAGLASSLSETGEGNVLLVDMTAGQGSAQQFYRGKQVVGLEEILSTRDSAQVQDKLYVVAEEPGREKLSRILPQRFTKLVPKLKASNFDYIIFDMPPVNQISITPRLAGFMDMVLLVIESEKTDRDLVQHATALLAQSNAHVGTVLNKSKNYVPSRLHEEYLGNG